MKIAMVASPYISVPPKKYGGTERIVYYLTKGLVDAGHKVYLFATGDSHVPGATLIPITPHALYFGKTEAEFREIEAEVEIINQKVGQLLEQLAPRIDLVHSHGYDLLHFHHAPAVTTHHGKFTLDNMDYYQERKHLNFISISNNQREGFPDLNYVGTAYNGLDPEDFPVVNKPKNYLTFIGRFDREKNPHLAIELALQLNIPIKVAGKLDYLGEGYLEKEVEPYFEHPLVEYLGELDMSEKIKLLSHSLCNLHPTGFREPFGLTVLEAAYSGTPTLAIARGSMDEIIEKDRTGLLVEDFSEGFHKFDQILAMDRNYIATRARSLFNYQSMTKQYLSAYEVAIAQHAQRETVKPKFPISFLPSTATLKSVLPNPSYRPVKVHQ